MKQVFFKQLGKQGIKLTDKQLDEYFEDFMQYCEEMGFINEAEIIDGASEYITCQIHYGVFK